MTLFFDPNMRKSIEQLDPKQKCHRRKELLLPPEVEILEPWFSRYFWRGAAGLGGTEAG